MPKSDNKEAISAERWISCPTVAARIVVATAESEFGLGKP